MPTSKAKQLRPKVLACTVGGAPRPIAISILQHRPDRIVFFASPESERSITQDGQPPRAPGEFDTRGILQLAKQEGYALPMDQWEVHHVDPQDLESCVEAMRRILQEYLNADQEIELLLDITGGTKLMTAALALVGRSLPCRFSYVAARPPSHGEPTRSKGGLGVTLDGQESLLYLRNPWDALGWQTLEEAILLFDSGDYQAAERLVDRHIKRSSDQTLRRRLSAWKHLSRGYASWDQFLHREALKHLQKARRMIDSFVPELDEVQCRRLSSKIDDHISWLHQLAGTPGKSHVIDLLANANRRRLSGRLDESALCLYRAVEAAAQITLAREYGIDNTGNVEVDRIPAPLLNEWKISHYRKSVSLNLQMDYQLLDALNDPLGSRFEELAMDQWENSPLKSQRKNSPLKARNESILAHGFKPIRSSELKKLWYKVLHLIDVKEDELPVFPRIGSPGDAESRLTGVSATASTVEV